jgi:hypothetical protein
MAVRVTGYGLVGLFLWPHWLIRPLTGAVPGSGLGFAFPRLFNSVLVEVPPHRAGWPLAS